MPAVTPFHYPPILTEVVTVLRDVLNAQDWHEHTVPHVEGKLDDTDHRRAELGNLQDALTHLHNASLAIIARFEDVRLLVREQEHAIMQERALEIARTVARDRTDLPGSET